MTDALHDLDDLLHLDVADVQVGARDAAQHVRKGRQMASTIWWEPIELSDDPSDRGRIALSVGLPAVALQPVKYRHAASRARDGRDLFTIVSQLTKHFVRVLAEQRGAPVRRWRRG